MDLKCTPLSLHFVEQLITMHKSYKAQLHQQKYKFEQLIKPLQFQIQSLKEENQKANRFQTNTQIIDYYEQEIKQFKAALELKNQEIIRLQRLFSK